jgi:hypothetical protein
MAGQTTWDKNTNVFDKVLTVDNFTATTPSGSIVFSATENPSITGTIDMENVAISGNLTVAGTTTFNILIVNTSSYSSGSTIFGDALVDTHQFTGSVSVTGSSFTWNNNTLIASNVTSSMSVASASQALTASYYEGTVTSASYALTASFLQGTASNALSASTALTASKLFVTNLAIDPGTYYPMFANTTFGPANLFADAATYTYQPSTNILTVTASSAFTASYVTPYETAWTSYTPTWTSAGTQPTLGDGTLTGAYKQIGKTVFVRVRLTFGTTTNGGTGAWYFNLPVTASSTWGIQMPVSILDNGNTWYQAIANGEYGGFTYKTAMIGQSAGGVNSSQGIDATFPFTFGNLDSLQFNGSYEAA